MVDLIDMYVCHVTKQQQQLGNAAFIYLFYLLYYSLVL